jgi:hypothetical protein
VSESLKNYKTLHLFPGKCYTDMQYPPSSLERQADIFVCIGGNVLKRLPPAALCRYQQKVEEIKIIGKSVKTD